MKKTLSIESPNRLTYALNDNGQIVNVDDVPTGIHCKCYCPACKEPLIAKNKGTKRRHHFAHQSGKECNHAVETMLHILAKEKIREAFLSKPEFWIEYEYKSYCSKYKSCTFTRYSECYKSEIKRFNLKEYYDSCEQEIKYDNINRRSDLKIFSSTSPNRSPIYLEFYVTHASDIEKLHSGSKIIEIRIETEEDIIELTQNGISKACCPNEIDNKYYLIDGEFYPKVCLYGFRIKDYLNETISADINFFRSILYKSGKMQWASETCNCKKIKRYKTNSLLEFCFHGLTSLYSYDYAKYFCYKKFGIRNCILCTNYVDSYNGDRKICRLYKHLQIPRYEIIDTARAKNCTCFKVDMLEMERILNCGVGEDFTMFEENITNLI